MTTSSPLMTLIFFLMSIPVFYSAGAFFLSRIVNPHNYSTIMRGILFTSAGLGIIGHVFAFLGHAGILNANMVLLTAFVFLAFGAAFYRQMFFAWSSEIKKLMIGSPGTMGAFLILAAGFVLAFAAVLLPEIANDALCYQLFLPKQFILLGSSAPILYDLNSYIPLLMNHLYMAGLLLGSISLAKIFHFLSGVLLTLALTESIRENTSNKTVAVAFGAAFFLTPTLYNQITTTYVDGAASLFAFLSFTVFLRALRETRKKDFFLAGLFFGFSASTKILALIAVIPLGMLCLYSWFRNYRKAGNKTFFNGLLFSAVGGLAGTGFWFIRNAWLTNNPFYPYLSSVFGTQEFHFVEQFREMGPPKTLLRYLSLPFDMTFRPENYDYGHWIGPFYLMVLPFFLLAVLRNEKMREHTLYVWGFISVWFVFFHNARFLLQMMPVYLWVAAWGAANVLDRSPLWRKRLIQGLYGLIITFLLLISVYHYRFIFKPLAGFWNYEVYLTKMERSYPAAQWANQHLPKNARIFNVEEIRMFYFDRPSQREIWFRLGTGYPSKDHTPEQLAQRLKNAGFTHILKTASFDNENRDTPTAKEHRVLHELFLHTNLVKPLHTVISENIREAGETYTFYQIL